MSEPSNISWGRAVAPYMIAILMCATAGVAQQFLQPVLGGRFLLVIFPATVVLATWLGGVGPGLLATLVVAVIADYFFLPPLHTMRIDHPADAITFAVLVLAGLVVSLAMRRVRQTLENDRNGRIVAERALKRTSELEALATALSKAHTLDEVTHECLSELLHAVGAAAGALALINDDGSSLEIVQAMGYADSVVDTPNSVPLASKTLLTEGARRQKPLTFTSQEDRRATFPDLCVDSVLADGEGAIVMPLLMSGRAIGAVAFSFEHPHAADNEEQEFLVRAMQRTAQAVDRARQYELVEHARADAEAFRVRADIELRERQKAEEALRESEARYRALAARTARLHTLSAGLSEAVTLDAVAKVVVRQGKVVAGASAGSVALLVGGVEFETLYAEEHPQQIVEAWHRFPADPGLCSTAAVETCRPVFVGSFTEWQQQYPRSASMAADGGYASAAALPLLVEGSAIGVLSFHFTAPVNFEDGYRALLTSVAHHAAQAVDRARLYEAAQHARADAEAANRSKDDFFSTVSHELMTPLSAVLGWAAMLRDQSLDATRTRRAVESIYNNAERQAHLIDELLDVSRIVAGRAPLDLQDVDLAETVRGAVEAIMPLAETKGLDVRLGKLPESIHVVADPHRLEQVFLNLLGNAVKFTPAGGHVTVEVVASDRSVDVRVVDTGLGIDPAFLPHVFERFRQADRTVARSVGGIGLGLFIARRLVDAHGGTIRVESEGEGRGAAFTVSLPPAGRTVLMKTKRAPSDTAYAPVEPAPSLDGVRVLLVEDEHDAREMMASVLEHYGATVTSASSAEAALERLTGDYGQIDVLLSDIAMPGKDGYELIREVRAQLGSNLAAVPAAAVTACAGADERERALSAGFQMHLAKPLNPEALAHAVASLAHIEVVQSAGATDQRDLGGHN